MCIPKSSSTKEPKYCVYLGLVFRVYLLLSSKKRKSTMRVCPCVDKPQLKSMQHVCRQRHLPCSTYADTDACLSACCLTAARMHGLTAARMHA